MGAIHFIKKEGFEFTSDKKVLKADEYLSWLEATDIIKKAEDEAAKIIEAARAEYQVEKEKGYQAGLMEGKKSISFQMMETIDHTVDYLSSIEEEVTDIVMAALRKVIGEMDDRELVCRVVKNALKMVHNQKQVILRVTPKEVETVKGSLKSLMTEFPTMTYIDVIGDERLSPGGCILETEIGVVEASIDAQLEAIKKTLTRKLKGNAGKTL